MLLQLIKKDIITSKKILILVGLFCLAIDNFFIFHDQDWGPFIRIGSGQVALIIGLYAILEKYRKGDMFICSLPVSRLDILRSRYAASVSIAIAGTLIIYADAFLLNMISTKVPANLYQFSGPEIFISIAFFHVIFISLFLPVVISLDRIWAIGLFGYITAILFILGMRYSDSAAEIYSASAGFGDLVSFLIFYSSC